MGKELSLATATLWPKKGLTCEEDELSISSKAKPERFYWGYYERGGGKCGRVRALSNSDLRIILSVLP